MMDSEEADRVRRLAESRLGVQIKWEDLVFGSGFIFLAYLQAEEECERLRRKVEAMEAAMYAAGRGLLGFNDFCGD